MIRITGQIRSTDSVQLDGNYGPYNSLSEAHEALSTLLPPQNKIGVTVGIKDNTTLTILEYWYQGGTEQVNLVKKQSPKVEANPEDPEGEHPSAIELLTLKIDEQVYMIPESAEPDAQLSDTSTNSVLNKVVKAALDGKAPSSNILKTALANDVKNSLDKADTAVQSSEKGVVNGVATLGSDGKVPEAQLPSYVDDVLEYANLSSFPQTGESGKIYVALDTNKTYRWSGSTYVEIAQGLALGETSSTAFAGNRGKAIEDKIPSNASSSNQLATASDVNSKLNAPATAGTSGQVLTSDGNGGQSWQTPTSGVSSYNNLNDKPQINSITLSDNNSASDLGLATATQGEKADNAIPMPIGTDGQILEKDSNETSGVKWVQKPQNGEDGLSAFQIAQQQGYTGTVDQWLASLKANIGAFKFVSYDSSAASDFTTNGIGTTYSGAIDSLVAGTDTTPDVILLMNNTNGTTTPTKTFMIATQEVTPATTPATYEFIYAGNLQSAMPSNVLNNSAIANNLTTNSETKVLSAKQGLYLNNIIGISKNFVEPTITVNGGFIRGSDGVVLSYTGQHYMECSLDGTQKYIKFSGSTKSGSGNTGYSFYDSNGNPIGYSLYSVSTPISFKVYIVGIPAGAVKFRATISDTVFSNTPYFIYLFNSNVGIILNENSNKINEILNGVINTPTFGSKSINSSGSVINSSSYNIYTLKVNKNDEVKVKLSCYYNNNSIAFGTTNNATSGLTLIQNGSNDSNAVNLYTYYCKAIGNGYLYFVSNAIPEYQIVRKEAYENDDSYYQDKFKNQKTIYPEKGSIIVYRTGSAINFNNKTRIFFKVFLEANKTSGFTLTNPNNLSLVYNNSGVWTNGNHADYVDWSISLTNKTLSITNPTSKNGYVIVALKKSDNSEFTDSDLIGLNFIRDFGSSAIVGSKAEFVAEMNRYAQTLGMSNTTFANPSGGIQQGYNSSCVQDILKMAIHAWGYEKIQHFMSVRSVDVKVFGANAGTRTITNSTQETFDTYYTEMVSAMQIPSDFPSTNPYIVLGRKGGGWSNGEYKAFSLVAFTEIDGKIVCGVSATNDVNYDGTSGRVARVKGMIELFNIAARIIRNQDITGMDTTFVEKAICAIVPEAPICYSNIPIIPLWSKNPTDTYNPASTTKIMTGMVAIDTLPNIHEYHTITYEMMENDSPYTAYVGDIETVETTFYACFLPSNSTNANALAIVAGNKMIESKNKFV